MASGPSPYCRGCGRPGEACAGCAGAYDPDRFCTACGTRLAVQVRPAGWSAACRRCGHTTSG
jgi:hypothetical protein